MSREMERDLREALKAASIRAHQGGHGDRDWGTCDAWSCQMDRELLARPAGGRHDVVIDGRIVTVTA